MPVQHIRKILTHIFICYVYRQIVSIFYHRYTGAIIIHELFMGIKTMNK